MQINEISKKYRISRKAILYYEQQGLITSTRLDNNYRNFDQANVQKLIEITKLRLFDVPVKVIDQHLNKGNNEILIDYLDKMKREVTTDGHNIELLESYIRTKQLPVGINMLNYLRTAIPNPLGEFLANYFNYYLVKDNVKYSDNEDIYMQIIDYIDSQDWTQLEQLLQSKEVTIASELPTDFSDYFYKQVSTMTEVPEIDPELLKSIENQTIKLQAELDKLSFNQVLVPLIRQLCPSYNLMVEKIESLKSSTKPQDTSTTE